VYDDLIMDHIKNARNYRVLDDVDPPEVGINPLCGDEVRLYVRLEAGRIADIAYQCSCCGISMASASIMTEMVQGRQRADAERTAGHVLAMLEQGGPLAPQSAAEEQSALLDTVRRFPTRVQCASLPWSTLQRALAEHPSGA